MTGFNVVKTIGTITSIVRTINTLKDSNNSTALILQLFYMERLFTHCNYSSVGVSSTVFPN